MKIWRVVVGIVGVLAAGCGDGSRDAPCGPREDLIGAWQRDGDALRIDLDATFVLVEGKRAHAGRYQVSDQRLRLLFDDARAVDSAYCVTGSTLRITALGSPFSQIE